MVAIAHPNRFTSPAPVRHLSVVAPARRPDAATYRRRRVAVALAGLVVLGLCCLLLGMLRPGSAASISTAGSAGTAPVVRDLGAYGDAHVDPPVGARYVVRPGDTLWSIAAQLQPGSDVRATVDRLAGLNGGAAIQPGQRLVLR